MLQMCRVSSLRTCSPKVGVMYLRCVVAGLLLAVASGQVCSGKSEDDCMDDLKDCGTDVTKKLTAAFARVSAAMVGNAVGKAEDTVKGFITNPLGAFQDVFSSGSEDLKNGIGAGTAVGGIVVNSLTPLLDAFKLTSASSSDAAVIPLKLVLQTMKTVRTFTESKELRNNSQIDQILNFTLPMLQVVNDSGLKCVTTAVGGLQQYPLLLMEWFFEIVISYLYECYPLKRGESPTCKVETFLISAVLNSSIWLMELLLSIF